METAITVIGVLLIIMGIFLIISVLMQSSKDHRLSGSIAGGAETFFGKQKGKTLDALFNKLTTVNSVCTNIDRCLVFNTINTLVCN